MFVFVQSSSDLSSNRMTKILSTILVVIFLFSFRQTKADSEKNVLNEEPTVAEKHSVLVETNNQTQDDDFPEFEELKSFTGDLNNDKKADKIIIYEKTCGKDDRNALENSKCRRVAVFLNENSQFKLFGFNDNLVECSECGGAGVGDLFQGVTIKNGYFSIESLYGACDKTIVVTTFRYDKAKKNFFLNKIGTEDYNCQQEPVNGKIKSKTKVQTVKNFGKIKFSDYVSE